MLYNAGFSADLFRAGITSGSENLAEYPAACLIGAVHTDITAEAVCSMIPSRLATDLDLVLDPAIRNWGVLPIVVFVLCINLLKSYAMVSTLADRVLSRRRLTPGSLCHSPCAAPGADRQAAREGRVPSEVRNRANNCGYKQGTA